VHARTLLAAAAAVLAAAATATGLATSSALATATPASPATVLASGGQPAGALPGSTVPPSTVGPSTVRPSTVRSAAVPAAACAEPNCDVTYHGGPVVRSPRVYLYFWGPKWKTAAVEKGAMNYLTAFYKGLGTAPDAWLLTAAQYGTSKGTPAFGKALYAGTKLDPSKPPASVTLHDFVLEADKGRKAFGITAGNMENSLILIAPQSGTCYAVQTDGGSFIGNCGKNNGATAGYCAFHDYDLYQTGSTRTFLPWINLPFQLDAGVNCGEGFVNSPGTYDGFSLAAGHETMEAISDPMVTAWYDSRDKVSGGGEIADKCAWGGAAWGGHDPFGDITLKTGKFAVQSIWSNAAGACVMSGKLGLKVVTPAAQKSGIGAHVSMQISTRQNGHARLAFKATGLPAGLSLGASSGKITGTVKGPKHTYHPKVTVSYFAGSATISFTWVVS